VCRGGGEKGYIGLLGRMLGSVFLILERVAGIQFRRAACVLRSTGAPAMALSFGLLVKVSLKGEEFTGPSGYLATQIR